MAVKRRKRRRLRKIWKNTLFMLAVIGISTLIHLYAPYKIAVVSGSSMEPTLHDRDILLFIKTNNVKDNQVAIFKSPKSWKLNEEWLIKRVLAKPGDKLSITEHNIYVNNKLVETFKNKNEYPVFIKNLDGYFVRGDNSDRTYDSLARVLEGSDDFLIKDIQYSKNIEKKQ